MLYDEYSHLLDNDGKEFVETIRANATNMGHLIDQLLKFSKLGRKKPEMTCVDMNKIARGIKEEIEKTTPHRAEIEIGTLPSIQADSVLVHQVLFNLISNAIKYSSKKRKTEGHYLV